MDYVRLRPNAHGTQKQTLSTIFEEFNTPARPYARRDFNIKTMGFLFRTTRGDDELLVLSPLDERIHVPPIRISAFPVFLVTGSDVSHHFCHVPTRDWRGNLP